MSPLPPEPTPEPSLRIEAAVAPLAVVLPAVRFEAAFEALVMPDTVVLPIGIVFTVEAPAGISLRVG